MADVAVTQTARWICTYIWKYLDGGPPLSSKPAQTYEFEEGALHGLPTQMKPIESRYH
jgi:hypothetical protein